MSIEEQTTLTESTAASQPLISDAPPKKRRFNNRQIISGILFLLISGGVTLVIFLFAPHIRQFGRYGYPGVFLISLIGNASIALPIPSLAVTFSMGAILSWPLVGLVAGIGEALGESTGYLAGYTGSALVENKQLYKRMQYWTENHGMLTIFVLSLVPNPLIDLAGITAGALKYGYFKFLFSCWMGKTIKTLFFAWAGSQSLDWIMRFLG
jgi:membrane protein DedA with SNARE-associated domain